MNMPPWIIRVRNIPWIPGNVSRVSKGFTFYPFIFLAGPESEKLLYHEKVHIRQQLDGWLIGFYIKYLYYQWKHGYWSNPYEIEARAEADRYMTYKNRR